MTESVKIGDRVKHYRYGRGVVERLVSRGLAEVRFGRTLQYVEQNNLQSLDWPEREAQVRKEREREERNRDLRNRVFSFLERHEYASANSLYQEQCRDWWPLHEYDTHVSDVKEAQARKAAEDKVRSLLENNNYDEADQLYKRTCSGWWSPADYEAEKARAQFMYHFIDTYRHGTLADLDKLYIKRQILHLEEFSTEDFVALKLPKIRGHLAAIATSPRFQ